MQVSIVIAQDLSKKVIIGQDTSGHIIIPFSPPNMFCNGEFNRTYTVENIALSFFFNLTVSPSAPYLTLFQKFIYFPQT